MKRITASLLVFASMTSLVLAQWTEWYPVHTAIQVSFKYGKKGTDYSYIRFKNVSSQEFKTVRVEFDVLDNGIAERIGVSTFNIKGLSVNESQGSWFHTDSEVRNIRITKLEDVNNKDVLKDNAKQTGVNEIYFPKKQPSPQPDKGEAEIDESEKRFKAWQEQEKRKQEEIKLQKEAAERILEQRRRTEEDLTTRKDKENEATKRRYKEQEEATRESQREMSNSINEAGSIILKAINDAESEREQRTRKVREEVERNELAKKEVVEKPARYVQTEVPATRESIFYNNRKDGVLRFFNTAGSELTENFYHVILELKNNDFIAQNRLRDAKDRRLLVVVDLANERIWFGKYMDGGVFEHLRPLKNRHREKYNGIELSFSPYSPNDVTTKYTVGVNIFIDYVRQKIKHSNEFSKYEDYYNWQQEMTSGKDYYMWDNIRFNKNLTAFCEQCVYNEEAVSVNAPAQLFQE